MNRKKVLEAASNLICGDRHKDYGEAIVNHQRIATGWNVIAKQAFKSHGEITPAHVALMMDWVKTSRLVETIDHEDSWIDKAGYSALGAEFIDEETKDYSFLYKRDKRSSIRRMPSEDLMDAYLSQKKPGEVEDV